MAADVAQKVVPGNDQPNGGEGIVSMAVAKGLTAANKISSYHKVSPSPPLAASQIDESITHMFNRLTDRFDDYNTYSA